MGADVSCRKVEMTMMLMSPHPSAVAFVVELLHAAAESSHHPSTTSAVAAAAVAAADALMHELLQGELEGGQVADSHLPLLLLLLLPHAPPASTPHPQ